MSISDKNLQQKNIEKFLTRSGKFANERMGLRSGVIIRSFRVSYNYSPVE